MAVDERRAGLDAPRDGDRPVGVGAPDRGAEPEFGVVGHADGVVDHVVGDDRDDWPELFHCHQLGVGIDPGDEDRQHVVPVAEVCGGGRRSELTDVRAGRCGALDEGLHPVLRRAVDERPEGRFGIESVPHTVAVDLVGEALDEFLFAVARDVDALDREADLTRARVDAACEGGDDGVKVDVVEQNRGVIAAELQTDPFYATGSGGHDLPADADAPGKRDHPDLGMRDQRLTDRRVTVDDVHDAGGKLLGDSGQHRADDDGGQHRWLDDHGVAGNERGSQLECSQDDRGVPGDDERANPDGNALAGQPVFVAVDDLGSEHGRDSVKEVAEAVECA